MNRYMRIASALALGIIPAARAAGPIGGFAMPSLNDEKATYRAYNRTWSADAEPNYPSAQGFAVFDPDIHGDTEGDDLWTYLMMFLRTGQKGYLDRAQAWADFDINRYGQCTGSSDRTLCYDEQAFELCHIYGWGLVAWYEYTGDAKALDAAEAIGDRLDKMLKVSSNNAYPVPGKDGMNYYGSRGPARQLHLFTRLAEATGKKRWIDLRDMMIDLWMKSPDWDARGMYFVGDWQTDYKLGDGSYASGIRVEATFQLGVLTEALAQAYRTTQDPRIKDKMVAMARFVEKYGLDPKYDYSGGHIGLKNGVIYHDYSATEPVTFWDPVYTTSLVNTLAWGWKLTGDQKLRDLAFHYFDRGNKGIYGEPIKRNGTDGSIHHFVDTRFSTSMENQYLDYNKGELQYTWLLFDQNPAGAPILSPNAPIRFSDLRVSASPGRVDFTGFDRDGLLGAFIADLQGKVITRLAGPSARSAGTGPTLTWETGRSPAGMYLISLRNRSGMRSQPFLLGW